MSTQEVDQAVAEIFGEDSEAATPSPAPARATGSGASAAGAAPLATQEEEDDALEQDLFGDFESGDEAPAEEPAAATGGRLKRAQPDASQASQAAAETPRDAAPKAKKPRRDLSKFMELEAEEAGASGDEEEEGDLEDLIDTDAAAEKVDKGQLRKAAKELEEVRRQVESAGPQGGARKFFGAGLDALEEKYKRMEEAGPSAAQIAPADEQSKKTAFVVPDAKDPKLWMVKTFAPEVELCISMMVKTVESMEAGKPIPLSSVFFSPHLRGYVYVESQNEADIRNFTQGIRGFSQWGISLVPMPQMPQVFQAADLNASKRKLLKVGDWVRMNRGPYKGDLGQIDEVKDELFIVKLKPRLQLEKPNKAFGKQDRAAQQRPPPKWFNKADVESHIVIQNVLTRMTPRGREKFWQIDKDLFRDGFLYKEVKSTFFISGDQVRPQEHELQDRRMAPPPSVNTRPDFEEDAAGKEEEERTEMPPPPAPPKKTFVERQQLSVGDQVIVTSGDVRNLRGVVTQALWKAPTVRIHPTIPSGPEMNMEVAMLCKYFAQGDYVKVLAGEHEGDTGFVLKVVFHRPNVWDYNTCAIVLSHVMNVEYKVRVDHLRLTSERADPQDLHGQFEVGQLIQVDGQNDSRGLIVRIEANSRAHVLGTDNKTTVKDFAQIQPVSLPSKNQYTANLWTLDRIGQKISPQSFVKAPKGSTKAEPIKAQVIYIHGNFLFLKATEMTGERAYSVCPGNKCEFQWSVAEQKIKEAQAKRQKEQLKQAGMATNTISYGVKMASETSWLEPVFEKMMGFDKDKNAPEKMRLEKGTNVRITSGSYKGLRAEVRAILGDKVRCSLLCNPKLVVVSREHVGPDSYWNDIPKDERWTKKGQSAPQTPPADLMPATPRGSPGTPSGEQLQSGTEEDMDWDPEYGVPKTAEKTGGPVPEAPEGSAQALEHQQAGLAEFSREDTELVAPAPTTASRRRRASRMPTGSLGDTMTEPTPQSPSALLGRERRDERALHLHRGVGVRYTHGGDGQEHCGWIAKVLAGDTAAVLPADAPDGMRVELVHVQQRLTRPWNPEDSSAEEVIIIDGPHRNTMGKVIGFENDTHVYLKLKPSEAADARKGYDKATLKYTLRTETKEVAKYNMAKVMAWEHGSQVEPQGTELVEGMEVEPPHKKYRDADSPAEPEQTSAVNTPFSPLPGMVTPTPTPAIPTPAGAMPKTPMEFSQFSIYEPLPPPGAQTPALPEEGGRTPGLEAAKVKGSETPMPSLSQEPTSLAAMEPSRLPYTPVEASALSSAQAKLPTPAAVLQPGTSAAASSKAKLPRTPDVPQSGAGAPAASSGKVPQTPAELAGAGQMPRTPAALLTGAAAASSSGAAPSRLPETPAALKGALPSTPAGLLEQPLTPTVPSPPGMPGSPPVPGQAATPAGLLSAAGQPKTPAGLLGGPGPTTPAGLLAQQPTTPAGLAQPTTPAGLAQAPVEPQEEQAAEEGEDERPLRQSRRLQAKSAKAAPKEKAKAKAKGKAKGKAKAKAR